MKHLWVLAFSVLAACQVATGVGVSGGSGGVGVGVTSSSGGAFSTRFGTRVYQVNNAVFEVVPSAFSAGTDVYWCGASDYARRRLGASWSEQIYLASKYVRSEAAGDRSAIQFTLTPEAAGVTPVDLNIRTGLTIGDHMSVQRANGLCPIFPTFPFAD